MKHASLVLLLGLAAACADVAGPLASPRTHARAHRSVVTPGGVIYTASALGSVGGQLGSALAINDNGQVAGFSYGANFLYFHAFRWEAGVMTDLGTLGGPNSYAYAMNSSGVVAGMATVTETVQHAAVWNGSTITDLGTLPGHDLSLALVINDQGVVAGQSLGATDQSAFRWQNGVMTALPTLGGIGSNVNAINHQGDIVGFAYATGNTDLRAALGDTLSAAIVGGPETVRRGLADVFERTAADEVIIATQVYDHVARLRSFEIVMSSTGTG